MTKLHLLGVAKVRRSLTVPIILFTALNSAAHIRHAGDIRQLLPYAIFDASLWIGVAFLVFAVIERRQKMRPQPRIAAMAAATVCIAGLALTIIMLRSLFGAILHQEPFVPLLLEYLPGRFYSVTFYIAIVTGIGYGVYSWAVEDQRLAEAAELDAAVARAELKAAAAHLQPESLDAALAHLSTLMMSNAAGAQRLISDLGAQLHDSLARSSPASSDTTARDSRRRPVHAPDPRIG